MSLSLEQFASQLEDVKRDILAERPLSASSSSAHVEYHNIATPVGSDTDMPLAPVAEEPDWSPVHEETDEPMIVTKIPEPIQEPVRDVLFRRRTIPMDVDHHFSAISTTGEIGVRHIDAVQPLGRANPSLSVGDPPQRIISSLRPPNRRWSSPDCTSTSCRH
jgi:hypothetical protein